MERKIVRTADGSTTIFIPEWDEHYHSKHGALQEAYHVFIKQGLEKVRAALKNRVISIMEIGFGTGLNAFITLIEAERHQLQVEYTGIEAYPISPEEVKALNFATSFKEEKASARFQRLHELPWEQNEAVTPYFRLEKNKLFFHEITAENEFDLIYFDAFGARVQPELWTEEIFEKMFKALNPGGVLVTYAAKGSVRRAMQSVGFLVERLPGPPGKREMLRATRPQSKP